MHFKEHHFEEGMYCVCRTQDSPSNMTIFRGSPHMLILISLLLDIFDMYRSIGRSKPLTIYIPSILVRMMRDMTAFRSRFYSHHSLIAIHLEKNNGSKKCAIDRRWRSQSRRPFWAWNSSWRRDCSYCCCNKLLLFWPPSTAVKGSPRSCFCFRRPWVEVSFEIVQLIEGWCLIWCVLQSDSNAALP